MTDCSAWDTLPIPAVGCLSRRKVKEGQVAGVYWAVDESANKCLLVEVGDKVSPDSLNKPDFKLRGLSFSLIKEDCLCLLIRLHNNQHETIFEKLCIDLCETIFSCAQSDQVFSSVKRRVSAWKKLLANADRDLLSENEKQGLFAELSFLADYLIKKPELEGALINGWLGPEKSQHDYVVGDCAIEIKSVTNQSKNKLSVSSEYQLFTILNKLFLRVYFVAGNYTGESALSLNDLVSSIRDMIGSDDSREIFESKLLEFGYIDISENDHPKFFIKKVDTYEVVNGFPRIIDADIDSGVLGVKYRIDLSSIEKYKIMEDVFSEYI